MHLNQLYMAATLKSQGGYHSPSLSSAAAAQLPTSVTEYGLRVFSILISDAWWYNAANMKRPCASRAWQANKALFLQRLCLVECTESLACSCAWQAYSWTVTCPEGQPQCWRFSKAPSRHGAML